jgi:DNA-binding FrmR family transcriptional regulator
MTGYIDNKDAVVKRLRRIDGQLAECSECRVL